MLASMGHPLAPQLTYGCGASATNLRLEEESQDRKPKTRGTNLLLELKILVREHSWRQNFDREGFNRAAEASTPNWRQVQLW